MNKYTLILNSHSLTDFQLCETKHLFRDLLSIQPLNNKRALERGTLIARLLAVYYYRKMKGKDISTLFYPPTLVRLSQKYLQLSLEDSRFFRDIMVDYILTYEKETWIPLAVEKGFSKILYEDAENLFIYEGRPDLIVREGQLKVGVDTKHQSMAYTIYHHNNQAMGYCWGIDIDHFVYNYIKFTKEERFRRTVHKFTQAQIDQWVSDTIEWFFRVKHSYNYRNFTRCRPACQDKYGLCDYIQICEQPSNQAKDFIIRSQFKKVKRYRSWG